MNRLLATLNPLTLALRLGRGAAVRLFVVLRFKLLLSVAIPFAAALVALAAIYTVTAPLDAARQLAAHLRGGAPNLPAHRAECLSGSTAVVDGRFTPEAQKIITEIPPNATIMPASAYLLYRWSHVQDLWQPAWQEWDSYLRDHMIRPTASDIEIAQSVDPQTDYTPFLVAARSTAIDLASGGPVVTDKKQAQGLAVEVYDECRRRDKEEKAKSISP